MPLKRASFEAKLAAARRLQALCCTTTALFLVLPCLHLSFTITCWGLASRCVPCVLSNNNTCPCADVTTVRHHPPRSAATAPVRARPLTLHSQRAGVWAKIAPFAVCVPGCHFEPQLAPCRLTPSLTKRQQSGALNRTLLTGASTRRHWGSFHLANRGCGRWVAAMHMHALLARRWGLGCPDAPRRGCALHCSEGWGSTTARV
jgi:hypothetical protein